MHLKICIPPSISILLCIVVLRNIFHIIALSIARILGYKGWWEYDSVTGSGIEEAFQTGEQKISVYLFGFKYTINLNKMQQCSEGSTNRIRKIRRSEGQMTDHKKGVAGIFSTNSKE